MSKLYKPTTREAYQIASILLNINLENGVVHGYCQQTGKSEQDAKEIKEAIRKLAESLHFRGSN